MTCSTWLNNNNPGAGVTQYALRDQTAGVMVTQNTPHFLPSYNRCPT